MAAKHSSAGLVGQAVTRSPSGRAVGGRLVGMDPLEIGDRFSGATTPRLVQGVARADLGQPQFRLCCREIFFAKSAQCDTSRCDHFMPARSRLIRPWTCWLGAPTPVCHMGEGLSVWTGRDSKVDTRRHAGCERVHRAAPIRRVGVPRVDRVDMTGLRQSELISPGDEKRLPRGF